MLNSTTCEQPAVWGSTLESLGRTEICRVRVKSPLKSKFCSSHITNPARSPRGFAHPILSARRVSNFNLPCGNISDAHWLCAERCVCSLHWRKQNEQAVTCLLRFHSMSLKLSDSIDHTEKICPHQAAGGGGGQSIFPGTWFEHNNQFSGTWSGRPSALLLHRCVISTG